MATDPICGMDWEPKTVAAEEDDTELRNMTLRFGVAFARSLPVLLLAMLPMLGVPVDRWLARTQPLKRDLKRDKVEHRIRQTRNGQLNASTWGKRMVGTGEIAEQIRLMFQVFRQKHGFGDLPKLDASQFLPPQLRTGQLRLF